MNTDVYIIAFYTQDRSFEVKINANPDIKNLLFDSFKKKETIELIDVSDTVWVINTASLVGCKFKVSKIADRSYLYI